MARRDSDDGMNDMAISYHRYLNVMLDTSRTDINDDSSHSSLMSEDNMCTSSARVEGMVDPMKSSFYEIRKEKVLVAKKQSVDIDELERQSHNRAMISFLSIFITICIASIILVTVFCFTPQNRLVSKSILSKTFLLGLINEQSTMDNYEINAFLDIPGSDQLLDLFKREIDKEM